MAARIVDPESRLELPTDTEGMLEIHGPNRMVGYLDDEGKTAEVVKDGWYVTGDMARIDADGFIHITGRQSRFSKIGGGMVPHLRVEEESQAILAGEDEELQLAVVAGVPDDAGVLPFDFDGDGDVDLVMNSGSDLAVLENDGSGGFTLATTSIGDAGASLAIGDREGDGDPDVLSGRPSPLSPAWLVNDGSPMTWATAPATARTDTFSQLALLDVNEDGNVDILGYDPDDAEIIYLPTGGADVVFSGQPYAGFGVLDADLDGDPDVVFANGVLDGATGRALWSRSSAPNDWPVPAVADVDLDGRPEIIRGSSIVDAATGIDETPAAMADSGQGVVAIGELDGDTLAPEIVDDEHPARCLHLQGRLIGAGDRVEVQIQHVEGEFTPGHHRGALALVEAWIVGRVPAQAEAGALAFLIRDPLVDDRIVDADDLAKRLDHRGHVYGIPERSADAVRDRGLTVARRAVEKHGAAGIHRRAELVEHTVGQHEV